MTKSGITRRIDELGRIVVPKEIRYNLGIRDGEPLEIYIENNSIIMSSDYSQIELRIMAAMSGDQNLIAAYRNHTDIHRLTASEVFHVPFDEVTPELRSSAKAVNFFIVLLSTMGGMAVSRHTLTPCTP